MRRGPFFLGPDSVWRLDYASGAFESSFWSIALESPRFLCQWLWVEIPRSRVCYQMVTLPFEFVRFLNIYRQFS